MSQPYYFTPALTPAEWDGLLGDGAHAMPWPLAEAIQVALARVGKADDSCAIMMLANAVLSDDDPRKITREDVRACDGWADYIDRFDRDHPLRALAAKLAALLPPA